MSDFMGALKKAAKDAGVTAPSLPKDPEPKDQGLEDAADVDCTTPPGWTPTEAFDDLAKEKH